MDKVNHVTSQKLQGRGLRRPAQHAGGNEARVIQPDVHHHEGTELAGRDSAVEIHKREAPTVVKIHHQLDALGFLRGQNLLALRDSRGERFLNKDVLPGLDGRERNLAMREIRSGNAHRLDVSTGDEGTPIRAMLACSKFRR